MTIAGRQVNTEPLKLWAIHLQRSLVISVVGVILWRDANNTTAWALFGAVVADLFHASKTNGGGGK